MIASLLIPDPRQSQTVELEYMWSRPRETTKKTRLSEAILSQHTFHVNTGTIRVTWAVDTL